MTEQAWTAVDHYLNDTLLEPDSALEAALQANIAADLPAIDVAPNQGKLLQLLAQLRGAKHILEIGTLGGYSTICLARALPADGKLITLELNPRHAAVARTNIDRANIAATVEIRIGPALDSLAQLEAKHTAPFELIFIDADKPNNPAYLEWSLRLSRPGTVIVCDNVVREGGIIDPDSTDPMIQGTRHLFELLTANPRLDATCLQTVGSKGHDGFILGVVKSA
jgi:predicted O-methyltransferase YrrM